MKRILIPLALAAAATVALVAPPSAASADSARPQPLPPLPAASAFGAGTINPWFPIVPGTTSTFTGAIDGVAARELYTVTGDVKVVDGVPANVIHDRLYLAHADGPGRYLAEDTLDWYATANDGDVWYLGEATTEYDEQGHVVLHRRLVAGRCRRCPRRDLHAGRARRRRGLPAGVGRRRPGPLPHHQRDGDTVTTREWTPLEPGLVTKKVYESGTGQVLEDTVKGQAIEDLRLELVGRS